MPKRRRKANHIEQDSTRHIDPMQMYSSFAESLPAITSGSTASTSTASTSMAAAEEPTGQEREVDVREYWKSMEIAMALLSSSSFPSAGPAPSYPSTSACHVPAEDDATHPSSGGHKEDKGQKEQRGQHGKSIPLQAKDCTSPVTENTETVRDAETADYCIQRPVRHLFHPVGNREEWKVVRQWFAGAWRRTPLVICGPSGTGKTFAVQRLASEYNMDIYSMGSDGMRTKDTIKEGLAEVQGKGFGKRVAVFIDDADGLDEPSASVIASASLPLPPIIIACNDYWSPCLRPMHSRIGPRSAACVSLHPVTGHHLSNLKSRMLKSDSPPAWMRKEEGKDAADAEWERKLAFEVNGDIRQYLLRLQLGPMATGKDAHFDSIFSRARFLMSESHSQTARADAYADMCMEILFETYPKLYASDEGMDRCASKADAFSGVPCNKHGFYAEAAEFVISNLLHTSQKIMPVFPRQMLECERRARRGDRADVNMVSCLATSR